MRVTGRGGTCPQIVSVSNKRKARTCTFVRDNLILSKRKDGDEDRRCDCSGLYRMTKSASTFAMAFGSDETSMLGRSCVLDMTMASVPWSLSKERTVQS